EERPPGLRWRLGVPAADVLRDRRLGDVDAEFEQFAVNPWRSPERIILRHRPNQDAHIGRDRWSPGTAPTPPGPEQLEALSMPGNDGLGFYDDKRRSPVGPRSRQPCPEPPVSVPEMEPSWSGPLEHLQLMAQGEILEVQSDT